MTSRFYIWIVTAISMVLISLGFSVAPAQANPPGCDSQGRLKAVSWTDFHTFSDTNHNGPLNVQFNITGNLIWVYCPNGEGPDKVRPKSVTVCYSWNGVALHQFAGIRANPYFGVRESDNNFNPPEFLVPLPTDGTPSNCATRSWTADAAPWFLMGRGPFWRLGGHYKKDPPGPNNPPDEPWIQRDYADVPNIGGPDGNTATFEYGRNGTWVGDWF